MLRGYKYRLYPNKQQEELINKSFGCCRFVYNLAIETKYLAYKYAAEPKSFSAFDLCYQVAELKKELPWLEEADSQALQASIKNAVKAFLNMNHGKGFPNFKSKYGEQRFQCPNNTREVDWERSTITIPKIPGIKASLSRRFTGQIKTVTITRTTTGKYFASILVNDKKEMPQKKKVKPATAVGIDMGLESFLIKSEGKPIANPRFLREGLLRIKVLQRRLRNKKRGSRNYKKAQRRIALHHEKTANKRNEFLHTTSNKLVKSHDTLIFEDLNIQGMSRRCRPKKGKNENYLPNGQSAKSGLNRSIMDAGWATFIRHVRYKCDERGKNFLQVDRFYPSSKTCSHCGAVNKALTLKDRKWACASCSALHQRDPNSAVNIKEEGLRQYFLTKPGQGMPKEPVEQTAMKGCNEAGIVPV